MRSLIIPVCLLVLFYALGCIQQANVQPVAPSNSIEQMSYEEALSIAKKGGCTNDGNLTGTYFYNNNSRTWWFDLDIKKQGCFPACVVWENSTSEINWRCTGLIVPNP